ncbi:hypothetical protein MMC31_005019, partial [Peltigera leucophlebia]|nr:hypothetical protein [Peltigera leucophlebia]
MEPIPASPTSRTSSSGSSGTSRVQRSNTEILVKSKALDLDDTVETSWHLQADIHSPGLQSGALAEFEGNDILSFSPLASNSLSREASALDEALSDAGPKSSLSSEKMAWDIRLRKKEIQEVPDLRFI